MDRRKTKTKPHGRGLQADLVNSAELGLNVGGEGCPRGVVGEERGGERVFGPSIQGPIPVVHLTLVRQSKNYLSD